MFSFADFIREGATEAGSGTHPWMVSIGRMGVESGAASKWQHGCGGSIVGQNSILTAAHCTFYEG